MDHSSRRHDHAKVTVSYKGSEARSDLESSAFNDKFTSLDAFRLYKTLKDTGNLSKHGHVNNRSRRRNTVDSVLQDQIHKAMKTQERRIFDER